jgi:low affinity Fe/Cu permease
MTRASRRNPSIGHGLEVFARRITEWAGSSWAFAAAVGALVVWALTGPFFHFSDTWQLVVNTATTIVTFLMVFLIQRSQNKDSLAIHLKLNEVVAAVEGASNRLISVEDLTEEEIQILRQHYRRLVEIAKHEDSLTRSHSIEEAESRHRLKKRTRRQLAAPPAAPGAQPPPADSPGPAGGAP